MIGSKKCAKCFKSIYHNDPQLALGGNYYHKSCARCATCNGYLSIKNFSTSGDRLLCKTHFKEEFSQGGGVYAGDDKFRQGGTRTSRANSPLPPRACGDGGEDGATLDPAASPVETDSKNLNHISNKEGSRSRSCFDEELNKENDNTDNADKRNAQEIQKAKAEKAGGEEIQEIPHSGDDKGNGMGRYNLDKVENNDAEEKETTPEIKEDVPQNYTRENDNTEKQYGREMQNHTAKTSEIQEIPHKGDDKGQGVDKCSIEKDENDNAKENQSTPEINENVAQNSTEESLHFLDDQVGCSFDCEEDDNADKQKAPGFQVEIMQYSGNKNIHEIVHSSDDKVQSVDGHIIAKGRKDNVQEQSARELACDKIQEIPHSGGDKVQRMGGYSTAKGGKDNVSEQSTLTIQEEAACETKIEETLHNGGNKAQSMAKHSIGEDGKDNIPEQSTLVVLGEPAADNEIQDILPIRDDKSDGGDKCCLDKDQNDPDIDEQGPLEIQEKTAWNFSDTEIQESLDNKDDNVHGVDGRHSMNEQSTLEIQEEIACDREVQEILNNRDDNVHEAALEEICEREIEKFIQKNELPSETKEESQASGGADLLLGERRTSERKPQHQLAIMDALPDLPLEIGDHVYQWRSFAGIPHMFQHHGIVMDIKLDDQGEMELQIADFSCILRTPSNEHPSTGCPEITQTQSVDMLTNSEESRRTRSPVQPHGILRVYNSSSKDPKWHKVHYRANVWKTSLWRSGTCTCVDSDPPAKVLARAYFLLEHPEMLPSYHVFRSNCECVALFCKTGFWSTLQASSLLSLTAAGQLKSTATLAAYAASQQVTVQAPAAGLWGYLGYTTTTQVSLLSTQPHLIPLLAAYGVVTAGWPTIALWKAKQYWDQTTVKLEEAFWAHAMKDPDTFARSMLHWSEKHKAFER